MVYTTSGGVVIEVGRVNRTDLDNIFIPEPVPPTRRVPIFSAPGAQEYEDVPVWDDVTYQRMVADWRLRIFAEQWHIIAPALTVTNADIAEAQALQAAGLGDGTALDWLHYTAARRDQLAIVELVMYNSTVTERGIAEAEARFGYTWRGKPLSAWSVSYTPGQRGLLAADYRAAFRSQLTWSAFCALPGQEQSALVAFWALEDRLTYLVMKYANYA